MNCLQHKKKNLGNCMWCGKNMCVQCIARKEGKKLYCSKCDARLGGVPRHPIRRLARPVAPINGNKFVLENGYLVIPGGNQ